MHTNIHTVHTILSIFLGIIVMSITVKGFGQLQYFLNKLFFSSKYDFHQKFPDTQFFTLFEHTFQVCNNLLRAKQGHFKENIMTHR